MTHAEIENRVDVTAHGTPVTGCRHECEYCYAQRIAERFGGSGEHGKLMVLDEPKMRMQKSGKVAVDTYPYSFAPTLHRYRLDEPYQRRGQNIFVCSMADLFGEWVPDEWIEEVMNACLLSPQHRYLFTSPFFSKNSLATSLSSFPSTSTS